MLPAGAENLEAHGGHTEAPATALDVPGGHGVQNSFLAPPVEKEPAGQLPDGDDRPALLQCRPGKHGVQSGVEAFPGEKDPNGQSPLTDERP